MNELKRKNEEKMNMKFEQMRMNQMVLEDNQTKINQIRRQRDLEKQKISEAIYLSKKEEAKQAKMIMLQNKQRKNIVFN